MIRLKKGKNKFQPLQHCDNIANYYADVLFALYADLRKEWSQNPNYHCIAKSGKTSKRILFTNTLKITKNYIDENIKEYSSALQTIYNTVHDDKTIRKGTIIFAGKSKNKDTVENTALIFTYGDKYYRKQIITRYDDHFTIENSSGNKRKMKYFAGGIDKIKNFRKISLTALMKKKSFDEGRKIGQRSKSEKKQASARVNGMKVAIRYKAEITDNGQYTEIDFNSGSDCYRFFAGKYKIFNNDMAFRRAVKNGRYERSTDELKIAITRI